MKTKILKRKKTNSLDIFFTCIFFFALQKCLKIGIKKTKQKNFSILFHFFFLKKKTSHKIINKKKRTKKRG